MRERMDRFCLFGNPTKSSQVIHRVIIALLLMCKKIIMGRFDWSKFENVLIT